jgi:hypothetical protein
MSEKQFALVVPMLYGILVIVSLGDPLMVLAIGRVLFGYRFDLILSLIPYGIIGILLAYIVFVTQEKRPWRFVFLIAVSVALFFVMKLLGGAEEKLHLIEFALFGALVYWTASVWGVGRSLSYAVVLAVGLVTVTLDESAQVLLSTNDFALGDGLVNITSTILGALTYAGLFRDGRRAETGDGEES